MSYSKHDWKTGDTVTSVKLNEMEAGIESGDLKSKVTVAAEGTATDEINYITIDGIEKKIAGAGKEGKVWKELTLSIADTKALIQGENLSGSLDEEYDIDGFRSDYFVCKVNQARYSEARSIFVDEEMNKVYVNVDGFSDILAYVANSVTKMFKTEGFDHNYYRTVALYGASPATMGKSFITEDFDGTNIIYMQDVSQQAWEYDYINPKEIEKQRREALGKTELGKAFVISIRGKDTTTDNSTAFLYCIKSSQTSYWDSSANITKWANIESGKIYPVHFDGTGSGEHGTLRWMLDNIQDVEGKIFGVEITTERKTYLANTGIEFSKDLIEGTLTARRCAAVIIDKAQNINANCFGVGDNEFTNIFSFNSPFGGRTEQQLEYIGRPNSYQLSTLQYTKQTGPSTYETKTEKNGYHLWIADVEGIPVELIIPDNYYVDEGATEPTPHRDTYIVRINFDSLSDTETIYRHTFTITTLDGLDKPDIGQYEINLAMCAVNPDMGDNVMEYLLHSDETGQDIDWILPVSGTIGRIVAYHYKGAVINPAKKYKAVTLTPAYDISRFEDLWESLPKQEGNVYYIFYGTDPSQSNRLINMRIEKEDVDHAFDLYVYDDYDKQSEEDPGKPYIRFVTQAISGVQKGFYMWDTTTHTWGTDPLSSTEFYDMFNSTQGVQGQEKVDDIFVGWDNSILFEIFSSGEDGSGSFKDMNVVAHTYTAMRMLAGWQTVGEGEEAKEIRTLFVEYIDNLNELTRVPVITDYNAGNYFCRDYRSEVLTVKTPVVLRAMAKVAVAK